MPSRCRDPSSVHSEVACPKVRDVSVYVAGAAKSVTTCPCSETPSAASNAESTASALPAPKSSPARVRASCSLSVQVPWASREMRGSAPLARM